MAMDVTSYVLSKGFTSDTADSLGAVKGAPCTIKSQTETDDSYIVTFEWTGASGATETSQLIIKKPKNGIDGLPGKDGKDGQQGADGSDGIGISKIEKIGTVDLIDTYRITFTDNSTFDYEVKNGKDGQGGTGASAWSEISDKPFESLSTDFAVENGELKVVGGAGGGEENVQSDWNETDDTADGFIKNKPTIPDITGLATETYVDNKVADYTKTADLADVATTGSYNDLADKPTIPSLDGYAKTSEIPSKVSELENDSNYLSSIPEEYVTDTELEAKGYLTEHQDISNLVEKEDGKTLISTEDISQIAQNKTDIETLNGTGEGSVEKKIADKLSEQTYLTKEIATVDEVAAYIADPTTAKFNVIYLVKDEAVTGSDKYFEYQRIGSAESSSFQMTGDTSTNLSDYAKTVDVNTELGKKVNTTDIVDSLSSDSTDKPLSAAQGKALDTKISDLVTTVEEDYAKKTDLHSHTNKTVLDGITEEKVTAWDKAQENIIESVKINNQEITPDDNKAVNIDLIGYAEHDEIVGENLIPYPYKNTSKSINGVEFVDNGDGTVTATGTSTSDAFFYLSLPMTLKAGTYVFSNNGLVDSAKVHMQIYLYETPFTTIKSTTSSVNPFTVESDCEVTIRLNVLSGETVDNYIFKPMLEAGSIVHEYQPYNLSRKALRTDIDNVAELASRVDNQFSTASGDYITVNDSVDGNIVELGIKGNSVQQTYSGKNLLNPTLETCEQNGVTCTNNGDGTYTLNGTPTQQAYFHIGTVKLTKGKTYKIVASVVNNKDTFAMFIQDTSGTQTVWETDNDGIFTAEYEDYNIHIRCYSGNANNILFKPMITTDLSATYDDFEPYVGGIPSPSPLYPQEIKSVGYDGSLVVKSRGKNLIPYPYDDGVRTNVGLTMTSLPNGMVNVNGTNTGVSGLFNFNYPTRSLIKLDHNKTYAFFNPLKTDRKDQITLGIRWYLEGQEISVQTGTNTSIAAHGNSNGAVIRSGFSYAYVYLYGYNSGKTFNNVLFAPMLVEVNEDGTYPTDYEIYKSSTSTIPLSEPLRAIGDIKDEITYQDGKWGVLRRTDSYIFDGSSDEDWSSTSTTVSGKYRFVVKDNNIPNYADLGYSANWQKDCLLCSHLSPCLASVDQPYNAGQTIGLGTNETQHLFQLYIEDMSTATVDEFREFLSNSPMHIIVRRVNPTFEPFADQTLPYLSTYDGVTNISNDDALSAEMTVKYPTTDASGVGSRNESRIAELAKDTDDKFDDVNDSLSVIGKCKNLLNPTLQTTTQNGVTCTNNGDGTFTVNGTVDSGKYPEFPLGMITLDKGKYLFPNQNSSAFLWCGTSKASHNIVNSQLLSNIFINIKNKNDIYITLVCRSGETYDNVVIKPMITTDLSATYDDFVPYTGDGETLTHDVADLKNNLAPKKIELQNVDERVTIQDNGSFIINGFAFVNLLVTFNETLPQWSNFVRLPRPKGDDIPVHCENSVRFTIYGQDNLPGDCGTYDIVQSGTEVRLLVNYEVA